MKNKFFTRQVCDCALQSRNMSCLHKLALCAKGSAEMRLKMSKVNPDRTAGFWADITLTGVGGHSSVPFKTHNPINAGFALIQTVQNKVWFEFDSFDNVVLDPIDFNGGIKENIIPDTAQIRYYGAYVTAGQQEQLKQILSNALEALKLTFQVDYKISYKEAA